MGWHPKATAPIWQFWNPQSGAGGGLIMGTIIGIIIVVVFL
jgi:hypothetical protein